MMFNHLFTLQKYVNNLGHQKVFPYIVRENPYSVCHFVDREVVCLMKTCIFAYYKIIRWSLGYPP